MYVKTMDSIDLSSTKGNDFLKCSYLFSALTHMRITQLMLKNEKVSLITVILNISKYADIVKEQICTLYDKDNENIGSLWLLNIYSSGVYGFISMPMLKKNPELNRKNSRYKNVVETHDYIMQILQQDVTHCDTNNVFYSDTTDFDHLTKETYTILNSKMSKNIENIEKFIKESNRPELLFTENTEKFTKNSIFMKYFATNASAIIFFEYTHYVQVVWNVEMIKKFKIMFQTASLLNWSDGNFKNIKDFYVVIFNFFKVIILRLTWKHFLYLEFQNINIVEHFAKEWLLIMDNFLQLTCVDNDFDIVKIKTSIINFIKYIPKYTNGLVDKFEFSSYYREYYSRLLSDLKVILVDICEPLGCFAVRPMVLFGDELPDEADKPPHYPTEVKTVEHYSLLNARIFLNRIILNMKKNDFGVIKSFINYIDKISKQ
ncbi:uncharacterized protein LOC126906909 isoform X2 [Daktulosphaira vitifoliae]|uniref:uncharacterized protein LOC126906909 isoform X2 n=1 Tax=Daktulosphaira vitifoliae TaxID=58002 RepID=UPI0021A996D8|nr:uncharacterized protein LOC126906909 isoform X2 [Daktulosphaira vitifoliae]